MVNPRAWMLPLAAAGLCLLGCATTSQGVTVPPPPSPDAPLSQRVAFYEEWSGAATHDESHWTQGGLHSRMVTLELQNGEQVQDPGALLAAVPEGSPTDLAIDQHARNRSTADPLGWAATGAMATAALGLAVGAAGVFLLSMPVLFIAGAALGFVAGGVGAVLVMVQSAYRNAAADAALDAYGTYNHSLRRTLNLGEERPKRRFEDAGSSALR